jgi:hypothetical protein
VRLYHVRRKEEIVYAETEALVIAARSEHEARTIASMECGEEGREAWLDTERSSCMIIAHECIFSEPIVVVKDFFEA